MSRYILIFTVKATLNEIKTVNKNFSILVKKDARYDVHLYPFHWVNPLGRQMGLFDQPATDKDIAFGEEL